MRFRPSFTRYLAAKTSVDDRALNGQVWRALASRITTDQNGVPLRVLEVGSGIGTMIQRLLNHGLLTDAFYQAGLMAGSDG